MSALNQSQQATAKTQVDTTSTAQHYYVVFFNEAEHENHGLKFYAGRVNEMIDKGTLIPFVPAFDLEE
jgi:hypothetical protein